MMRKFVIVKHNNGGKFLFYVPENEYLSAGDQVVCDTKHNPREPGVCCCDSFLAEPEIILPLFGTHEKSMKYVVGRIQEILFDMTGENSGADHVGEA